MSCISLSVGVPAGVSLPPRPRSLTLHRPPPQSPRFFQIPHVFERKCSVVTRAYHPLAVVAMVNVDFSPATILGAGLVGLGLALYQVRAAKPWISRDYDVIISSVAILTGGILIFQVRAMCHMPMLYVKIVRRSRLVGDTHPQPPPSSLTSISPSLTLSLLLLLLLLQGWRLDPLLLFGELMTAGAAVALGAETLSLRAQIVERESSPSGAPETSRRVQNESTSSFRGGFGAARDPYGQYGEEAGGYGGYAEDFDTLRRRQRQRREGEGGSGGGGGSERGGGGGGGGRSGSGSGGWGGAPLPAPRGGSFAQYMGEAGVPEVGMSYNGYGYDNTNGYGYEEEGGDEYPYDGEGMVEYVEEEDEEEGEAAGGGAGGPRVGVARRKAGDDVVDWD